MLNEHTDCESMLPEPLLTKIDSLIHQYPFKRSALIPMLLLAQENLGYVTSEAIQQIAALAGIPEIEVREVITFYSMLRTHPVGKYHIQVCTNISCMLVGGETLLEHISKKLGIRSGETTPDGLFSLIEVECLGACCNAPAIQINYQYHQDLTLEKIDQLLDELKSQR
jgi:NADH-quinone oxidoreductase subunit E